MSDILLDTNVLIDLVFDRSEAVSRRFSAALVAGEPLYLSAVSLFEYRFGAERSRRRSFQLEALERFLATVAVVEFVGADAERAALLKATLSPRGQMIGPYDLLIASQALERNLALATGNLREFSRVEGLVVQDWGAGA